MIMGQSGLYLPKTTHDHGLSTWRARWAATVVRGAGVRAVAAGLVARGVGQPPAAAGRRAAPQPGPAVAAGVEHQAGHGHRGQPAVQRRAVARVVQVRGAVVPGQLRLAVLGLEQRGQLAEEAVFVRLAEDRRELSAEPGQRGLEPRGLVRLVAVVGDVSCWRSMSWVC